MSSTYLAEVVRSREPKGPGKLTLYRDGEAIGSWSCITGGDKTDPAEYGGLTPPIEWVMIEPIASRAHPKGHRMEMARLLPLEEGKSEYPKRTYSIHDWPFMIHVAGSTSGCIAIERSQWRSCVDALNAAWAESTFVIRVEDAE